MILINTNLYLEFGPNLIWNKQVTNINTTACVTHITVEMYLTTGWTLSLPNYTTGCLIIVKWDLDAEMINIQFSVIINVEEEKNQKIIFYHVVIYWKYNISSQMCNRGEDYTSYCRNTFFWVRK